MSSATTNPSASRANPLDSRGTKKKMRTGFRGAWNRTWVNRRTALFVLVALAFVAGVLSSWAWETTVWTASARLEIPENALPDDVKLDGTKTSPAEFSRFISLLKNPEIFKKTQVGEEMKNLLTLIHSPGTRQFYALVKASQPSFASDILADYVNQLQIHFRDMNASALAKSRQDIESQIASLEKKKSRKKTEEHKALLEKNGITDLSLEFASIRETISSLEYRLRQATTDEVAAKKEWEELRKREADLKSQEQERRAEMQAVNNAIEIFKRTPLFQSRIRELINDEKERLELRALFDNKLKEKKALEDLVTKGKSTPDLVLRLDTEIAVLKTKMEGNKAITDLNNELRKLDQLQQPESPRNQSRTNSALTQTLDKLLDKELMVLGCQEQKSHLEKEIEAQKTRLQKLTAINSQARSVEDEITNLGREIESLRQKDLNLAHQQEHGKPSMDLLNQPITLNYPPKSNRYQIFSGVFVSGTLVGFFLLFLTELLSGTRTPADLARTLNIPVQLVSSEGKTNTQEIRDVCRVVRNQSFLTRTVLQAHPLSATESDLAKTRETIEQIAEGFAQRGEKVLIVNLVDPTRKTSALFDFLQSSTCDLQKIVENTPNQRVDRLIAGKGELTARESIDGLMKTRLETATASYGVVLIQADPISQVKEVETLGTITDGLIVIGSRNQIVDALTKESLLDLASEGLLPRAIILV